MSNGRKISYEKLNKGATMLDKVINEEEYSYEELNKTITTIGKAFGMTDEDFEKDKITRENLFNPDKVIVIE